MAIAAMVCLANSRKFSGRCVAGLRWDGKCFGKWIRPISQYGSGELHQERLYVKDQDPQLLDVIELSLGVAKPIGCHSENYVNQSNVRWNKLGVLRFDEAAPYAELPIGPLWVNAGSTYEGENDSIPNDEASKLSSSLKLIQPKRLKMVATSEGGRFGTSKRRVRGSFTFGSYNYKFSVTDSRVEAEFASEPIGFSREVKSPLLCLSISEPFDKQNACYKLIAGVMEG